MIQGTPQAQIGTPPPGAPSDAPSAIPVQTVDADQLPREKGLTYEEVTSILGSLYLDSHHAMKVREDQFNAVSEEYDRNIMQLKAQLQAQQEEIGNLNKKIATLQRELETRNGQSRPTPPTSSDGHDTLQDN
jgi:predicted RNase H-like nuclease (RuvC/YqgF family)